MDMTRFREQMHTAADAMRRLTVLLEQHDEDMMLAGWPHDETPTLEQWVDMDAIHNELLLHEPGLGEARAWLIAGNCVARCALERRRAGVIR